MAITAEDIIRRREEEEAQQQANFREYISASAPEGVAPEALNAMYAMADEVTAAEKISKKQAITGTALSVGTEIGGSIAGGLAWSKYMNAVRIANAARAAGSAAVVTPEPASTAIGAGVFLAGEAAIGAASNFAGQQIRKAYGLQDKTSWGEVAASSVFNLTVVGTGIDKAVAKAGEKVFKIQQPSLQSMKAWKRQDLLVFGVTKSVSGAAMGLSESVLRQEVEIALNDRENRDTYDYLLSAGFGAGFNSLFNLWGKTGAWGRRQATKVFESTLDSLNEKLVTAESKLADLQKPLPVSVTRNPWVNYGGSASIGREMAIRTTKKEIDVIKESLELTEDAANNFAKAEIEATNADLAEPTEQPKIQDPGEYSQPDLPKIEEDDIIPAPQATPDAEGVTPPVEKVELVTESSEELNNPIYVDDAREQAFLDIFKRSQLVKKDSPTHKTNLQSTTKALRDLQTHTQDKILHLVNELHIDAGNQSVAKELSNEINFLRKVNLNTGYALEFMTGSGLRGFKADDPAAIRLATQRVSPYFIQNPENPQYKQISPENIQEDEALDALLGLVNETAKTGRTPDELAMRETLESITAPKAPEEAVEPIIDVEKIGETAEEIIQKPEAKPTKKTKKTVKKPTEDPEKSPEDVLAEKLQKLQNQLDEYRGRFGKDAGLPKPKDGEQEDPLVKDIKERIAFYRSAENEAKNLPKLEDKLRALQGQLKAAVEVDVGIISKQRAFTKRPSPPSKPRAKSAIQRDIDEVQKKIRDTRSRIKQRIKEIDQARIEMSQEFQLQKAEQQKAKLIKQREEKLDKLRKEFGRDIGDEELIKQAKEKDPEIADLDARIKFYQDDIREAKEITKLEKDIARLLDAETGIMTKQALATRKVPMPETPAKSELVTLRDRKNFLLQNMRNRRKEIEQARREMSEEFQSQKLLEQQQKALSNLDEQIAELRKKVFDEPEETKPKLKKQVSPEVKEKLRIKKFYQDAIKENEKYIQRLQQRKEILEAEGRGVISEMRGITAKKPKGPTKTPGRLQKLEKQIADSKKRMAQKLKDIDKAINEIKDEEFIKLLYNSYLNTAITVANRNKFGAFNSSINWFLSARRLAMIDQLPSVAAAVPAGIGVGVKQALGFIPEFIFTAWKDKSISKASKMALADLHGTMAMFSTLDLKEMMKYSARTFVEGRDITNNSAMKYFDHHGRKTGTRLMQKAYANAMARDQGVTNITNYLLHTILNGKIMDILSIGARGIGVMDGIFQRQLIRGRMYSDSLKQAIDINPDASVSELKEVSEKMYQKQWKDDDGVAVLSSSHDQSIVNQVEVELLKAANTDDIEGTVTALIEKGIKLVEDRANTSVRALMSILMPFLGVGVRGTYRGVRYSTAPLRAFKNPHNPKLESLRFEQQALTDSLEVEGLTPEAKLRTEEEIKTVAEEILRVQKLRNDYNLDILKDTMVTLSLGTVGYLAGRYGFGNGSLAWMSDEQKRDLGKETKKFTMFGVEYSAAAPFNFPLAAAADLGMYHRLKELELSENKKFLTSEQDLFSVFAQSNLELLKDQPITSSLGDIADMVSGSSEKKARAQSRFVSSFIPVPAQIRKFVRQWEESGSGTVADMKGASFQARIVYNALGHGAQAKRTDRFGEDILPTGTWFSTNVMRQFPQKFQTLTKLEEYILADSGHNNIKYKPSTIAGINMANYVDAEGVPLWYHYDLRLRKKKIGKKTMLEKAEALVSTDSWQRKFNKGFIQSEDTSDKYVNQGLLELNKVFSKYYNEVRKDILKDKYFLSQFVDQKDRSLFDVIGRMTGAQPENLLEKREKQKEKGKVGVRQMGALQELRESR